MVLHCFTDKHKLYHVLCMITADILETDIFIDM